jgi:hypothetical protein
MLSFLPVRCETEFFRITYTDWISWASAVGHLRIVVLTLK